MKTSYWSNNCENWRQGEESLLGCALVLISKEANQRWAGYVTFESQSRLKLDLKKSCWSKRTPIQVIC